MNRDNLALPFRLLERFPKVCLIITFTLLTCLWMVTGILLGVGYDIAPFVMDFLPIQIQGSPWYQRASAVLGWYTKGNKNNEYMNFNSYRPSETSGALVDFLTIDLFYKVDGNILTDRNMKQMKKIEDEITSGEEYKRYFRQPHSLLNYIENGVTYTNENITTMLDLFMQKKNTKFYKLVKHAFPKSFEIKPKQKYSYSNLLRSSLIARRHNGKKVKILHKMLKKQWQTARTNGDYEFAYFNIQLYYDDLADQALHDTFFTIGSFLFILIVLLLHTHSVVLTLAAIFGILSSVLGGNLIYRVIFDQRYLGVFHCISLFVVLGIGADDVFVLFDVWRASFTCADLKALSHGHRMASVFRKAMFPMFVTSFTTAMAFFVNVMCKVPIVSTFGLFTGLVVIVNYLMVITFLPCVLINQQLFYEWLDRRQFCLKCIPSWITRGEKVSQRWIAHFFGTIFYNILRVKIVAAVSVSLSLLASVLFIWRATKLAPAKSTIQFFVRGTNYFQANNFDQEFEKTTLLTLDIVWGLRMQDRSMCHKHNFKCDGKIRYDNQLDLNLWDAQLALLYFTRLLKNDSILAKRLRIQRENDSNAVRSFLLDMQADMLYQHSQNKAGCEDRGSLDLTLPIGQRKVDRLMSCRPDLYGSKAFIERLNLSQWYDRFFETAHNYWIGSAEPGRNVPNNSQVESYALQDVTMKWIPRLYNSAWSQRNYYGGRLVVMGVYVTLDLTSDDFVTGALVRDNWERFIEKSNADFPLGLRGAFQCMSQPFPKSPINMWEWYDIQEELWFNAYNGILLGLFVVAFPILLLSTLNLVLTLVGVLCLGCVTVTVVAMAEIAGWSLGITESINFAMVTGLSVDYIVHFIEAYSTSKASGREAKSHDMLMKMGGAVTSGMLSTVGSTLFLFGASVIFFVQFGAFMATTIGSAFCFTMFLLTPSLILFGPTEATGSPASLLAAGMRRIQKFTIYRPKSPS